MIIPWFQSPFATNDLADHHLLAAFLVYFPSNDVELVAFRESPADIVDEPFWSNLEFVGFFAGFYRYEDTRSLARASGTPLLDLVHDASELDLRFLIEFDLRWSWCRRALRERHSDSCG